MYPTKTFEPEIREIGGEPLKGSGFETQDPETEFDLDKPSSHEDVTQ